MKLYRFEAGGRVRLGVGAGNVLCDVATIYQRSGQRVPDVVEQTDVRSLCAAPESITAFVTDYVRSATHIGPPDNFTCFERETVRILPPLANPGKFFCVGLNYRDHCEEQNVEPPPNPMLFAKFNNAICGHRDKVTRPVITQKLDFEGELAVIIGRGGQGIKAADALSHVFGYTIVNDVSAREVQKNDKQWLRAKSQDGFAPMGPCIVTADEIRDPQTLGIRTLVNGETMQDSNTSKMIFGVAYLIEFITQGITLEPGDLISTGTPHGVGQFREPPVFLKGGDRVDITIDKIGTLSNEVVE
jgi:2-keto-4-pentenoate hydratase/2-oxohepta-3-ene-1,7-dioic acid hydratase in catechol pathway